MRWLISFNTFLLLGSVVIDRHLGVDCLQILAGRSKSEDQDFAASRCLSYCLESIFLYETSEISLDECYKLLPCSNICINLCHDSPLFRGNNQTCHQEFCAKKDLNYPIDIVEKCNVLCNFVKEIYESKSGTCPKPPRLDVTSSTGKYLDYICHSECENDYACPTSMKCCPNDDSSRCYSCQSSLSSQFEFPPLVGSKDLKVVENVGQDAFDLSWDSWDPIGVTGKVIFVIRQRNVTGYYNSLITPQPWNNVGFTDKKNFSVSTKPGWWSEFQVASVNKFGSKGFKMYNIRPSCLSREPSPPNPPFNIRTTLTQLETSLILVNNVTWFEPEVFDLPVVSYSVSFSCSFGSSQFNQKYSAQSLCRFGFCFLNLSSSENQNRQFRCSPIRFFVTVTAHCQNWGDKALNSSKVSRDLVVDQNSWLRYFDEDLIAYDDEGTIIVQVDYRKFAAEYVTVIVKWVPPVGKEAAKYSLQRIRGFCTSAGSDWILNFDQGRPIELSLVQNKNLATLHLHYECEYAFQVVGISKLSFGEKYVTKRYVTPSCEQAAVTSRVDVIQCGTAAGGGLVSVVPPAHSHLLSAGFTLGTVTSLDFFFLQKNISTLTVNAVVNWSFDDNHYRIVTNEELRDKFLPVIEILVYEIHEKIGIINHAQQPCVIYLDGFKDPDTGVVLLPNRINLLDRKLPRPCLLRYKKQYRLIARIVYNSRQSVHGSSAPAVVTENGGPWSGIVMDTSVISFFDVFPPWKQDYYKSIGINSYLEAIEFERHNNNNNRERNQDSSDGGSQSSWRPSPSRTSTNYDHTAFYYEQEYSEEEVAGNEVVSYHIVYFQYNSSTHLRAPLYQPLYALLICAAITQFLRRWCF